MKPRGSTCVSQSPDVLAITAEACVRARVPPVVAEPPPVPLVVYSHSLPPISICLSSLSPLFHILSSTPSSFLLFLAFSILSLQVYGDQATLAGIGFFQVLEEAVGFRV